MIILRAWSACSDSEENWTDARARLCCKARKSWRTERSGRGGLWFRDRGLEICLGCAARVDLRASLEKGRRQPWITGSNNAVRCPLPHETTFPTLLQARQDGPPQKIRSS